MVGEQYTPDWNEIKFRSVQGNTLLVHMYKHVFELKEICDAEIIES